MITYNEIKNSAAVKTYIGAGNDVLAAIGYTEHGFAHAELTAARASYILETLEFDGKTVELCKIAAYLHDIGNMINREQHALTGAALAFSLLSDMGAAPDEIAAIVTAIGNHDEMTGRPSGPVSAALVLADKSDVRRSRVRKAREAELSPGVFDDIHDRVNFAAVSSELSIGEGREEVALSLKIDTAICPVMDYFEIFLNRMLMCRRAADFLGLSFRLVINGTVLL